MCQPPPEIGLKQTLSAQMETMAGKKPKSISVKKKTPAVTVKLVSEPKEHVATFTPLSQAQ